MASIRQNAYPDLLPDFRNLGVIARVLVIVNAAVLIFALAAVGDFRQALERFVQSAIVVEPLLLGSVIVLYAFSPLLGRLTYWAGCAVVLAAALALAAGQHTFTAGLIRDTQGGLARVLVLTAVTVGALLAYFRLFTKAFSPALAEARLQALQARIRPHFLFNSLNAVLALIRRDPKRAERTLENLADLFRTLMSDARQFVRLADEIALLERYAELEELRLGERLRITWELDAAPLDALLPPLLLQPLLENAVYHGAESATGTADVLVRIGLRGDHVLVRIENPYVKGEQHPGNRMALENTRERLALFFDAEARIETRVSGERYWIEIEIPYRSGPA